MSQHCIDATIEIANSLKKPIALIPSRRQIEAQELGGGYVNNWSTQDFVNYVRKRDSGNWIVLSRDHSGPWQGNNEDQLTYEEAMRSSLTSLRDDVRNGIDLIHIDPSQGLSRGKSELEVEADIIDLVEFSIAQEGNDVEFEIGADEQNFLPESVAASESKLQRILGKLNQKKLPKPLFYVLQTGTKVKETQNIGSFDAEFPVVGMLPASVQVPEMIRMCERNALFLKEHNADYLSDRALDWHPRFGIHAANVAPQFGVVETSSLIRLANENNAGWFIEKFFNLVLEGRKWSKWLLENSMASDYQKLLIAGHYHFSNQEFLELRAKLNSDLLSKGVYLEDLVKNEVKVNILRYAKKFGY